MIDIDQYFEDIVLIHEVQDDYPQDYIFRDYDLFHRPMQNLDTWQRDIDTHTYIRERSEREHL